MYVSNSFDISLVSETNLFAVKLQIQCASSQTRNYSDIRAALPDILFFPLTLRRICEVIEHKLFLQQSE